MNWGLTLCVGRILHEWKIVHLSLDPSSFFCFILDKFCSFTQFLFYPGPMFPSPPFFFFFLMARDPSLCFTTWKANWALSFGKRNLSIKQFPVGLLKEDKTDLACTTRKWQDAGVSIRSTWLYGPWSVSHDELEKRWPASSESLYPFTDYQCWHWLSAPMFSSRDR